MLLLTKPWVCSEWNWGKHRTAAAGDTRGAKCSVLLLKSFMGFVVSPTLNMGQSSVENAKLCLGAALLFPLLLSAGMFLSAQKNTCQGFNLFCFRINLVLPFICHLSLTYDAVRNHCWILKLQVVLWQGDGCCLLSIENSWSTLETEECRAHRGAHRSALKWSLKRRKLIKSRAATLEKSTCFKQVTNPTGVKCSAGSELQEVSQLNLSCGGSWAKGGRDF